MVCIPQILAARNVILLFKSQLLMKSIISIKLPEMLHIVYLFISHSTNTGNTLVCCRRFQKMGFSAKCIELVGEI